MSRSTSHPLAPSPSRRQRSLLLALVLTALAAVGATACDPLPPAPPGGTAADCRDMTWGSVAKRSLRPTVSPITGVRAGSHRCFDRLVIDLQGHPAAGWDVRYHAVERPGTGTPLVLRGRASLEVVVGAPAHDAAGRPTYAPKNPTELVDVSSFDVFRQLAFAGSFEGQTTFGIGVRSRLPFRVWAVQDGPRGKLVIDVARRWP